MNWEDLKCWFESRSVATGPAAYCWLATLPHCSSVYYFSLTAAYALSTAPSVILDLYNIFLVFSYFWKTEKAHLSVLLWTDINMESGSWFLNYSAKNNAEKNKNLRKKFLSIQSWHLCRRDWASDFQQSNQTQTDHFFTSCYWRADLWKHNQADFLSWHLFITLHY